jgi:preprotein translocase SecE subunit
MANFIKESLAELEHVVWPTHIETKKFFQAVVGIIVAMTIFTYILTLASVMASSLSEDGFMNQKLLTSQDLLLSKHNLSKSPLNQVKKSRYSQ